ncbi:MAG TPA: hypothetical protein VK819_02345 [Acidobacteriaceae bacterium]|jgi:hypothetical protein|nr:hypothetical protein [Acidobacteriaceae bacterium]
MLNFAFLWLEALAGFKALYDLTQGAGDYATYVQRHRQEQDTIAEANRVSAEFSTYSFGLGNSGVNKQD